MAVREAILSVAGWSLTVIVVLFVVAMLVRKAMIIVVLGVRVMRIGEMRIAVLVRVLVGAMAERVMLDTVLVRAEGVVKRHVNGWQGLEAGQPKQASEYGADTGQSLSSTAIHCSGTVAIFPLPINHRCWAL